ncbi:MAG: cytochrome c oxidase subunit [Ignavibacteria bacterium]|nr:cytochrome c oxidase subunit [Ignavibacteria bacterium]
MFTGPSTYASEVDSIMLFIVASSVALLLIITVVMIYFVFRYNKKRNPVAENIEGNTPLEILWIAIPTVLVMFMFYYGYVAFADIRAVPANSLKVKVLARMWSYSYEYENGKQSDTLFLPNGRATKLDLISADVNHGFFVPAFRIKEDVIAGKINYLVLNPKELGSFDIACSEYCGLNHSLMYSKLVVIPDADFKKWLSDMPKDTIKIAGK